MCLSIYVKTIKNKQEDLKMENVKNLKPIITQAVKTEYGNVMEGIVKEADRVSACAHIIKDPNVEAFASSLTLVPPRKGDNQERSFVIGSETIKYKVEIYKCTHCGKEVEVIAVAADTIAYLDSMIGLYEMFQSITAVEKTLLATKDDIVALGDVTVTENGVSTTLNVGERLAGLMTGIMPASIRMSQSPMSLTDFNISSDIMRASDLMMKEVISVKMKQFKYLKDYLTNKATIEANQIRVTENVPTTMKREETHVQIVEKVNKGPVNKLVGTIGVKI